MAKVKKQKKRFSYAERKAYWVGIGRSLAPVEATSNKIYNSMAAGVKAGDKIGLNDKYLKI